LLFRILEPRKRGFMDLIRLMLGVYHNKFLRVLLFIFLCIQILSLSLKIYTRFFNEKDDLQEQIYSLTI